MEHLHHFGVNRDPFSNEPDLRCFFESDSHRDAQRRVERGLRQHKGLTILTGENGMGKTLLARRILEALEEEVFEATLLVMLPGASGSRGILQRVARQFGCDDPSDDRADLLAQIYEQLAIVREDGRHAVLMIDDAQIMTPEVLSELSGLLNLEYEDRRLLSMLFVGSAELDRRVQEDATILPRIDVRVRMRPLDMVNASAYLAHRLESVGGSPSILPSSATQTLFKFGRGRPRLINTLADNALFEAYLAGRDAVEGSDIERAAADLGIGPDPGTTHRLLVPLSDPGPVAAETEAIPEPIRPFDDSEEPPVLEIDDALDEDFELVPEPGLSSSAIQALDFDADFEVSLDEEIAPERPSLGSLAEETVQRLEFDAEPPSETHFELDPIVPDPDRKEEPVLETQLLDLDAEDGEVLEDAVVELLED